MANVAFSKLNCTINQEVKYIEWNDNKIEVQQYLPIQKKLGVMQEVIELSMTQYNYANPVQVEVYTYLSMLKNYTNIKFTDKQLADPAKLYDMVKSSGLLKMVCDALPTEEINELMNGVNNSIQAFYSYRTSILGIMDALKSDYSGLNSQLTAVLDQVKDPEALAVLKAILPELTAGQVD